MPMIFETYIQQGGFSTPAGATANEQIVETRTGSITVFDIDSPPSVSDSTIVLSSNLLYHDNTESTVAASTRQGVAVPRVSRLRMSASSAEMTASPTISRVGRTSGNRMAINPLGLRHTLRLDRPYTYFDQSTQTPQAEQDEQEEHAILAIESPPQRDIPFTPQRTRMGNMAHSIATSIASPSSTRTPQNLRLRSARRTTIHSPGPIDLLLGSTISFSTPSRFIRHQSIGHASQTKESSARKRRRLSDVFQEEDEMIIR